MEKIEILDSVEFEQDLQKLEMFAELMDRSFTIPGTSIRFGLDSLIGLLPGIGDTVTLFSLALFLRVAKHYDVPWYVRALMVWNAFVDWLIGIIPLIGDIFDVGWKSNIMNVGLIKKYARRR